jgi:Mn2+/Fe2+ NRAMP family transporter
MKRNLLSLIGPGILVAATGIGAGDLATAAFTGSRLGVAILWAVVVGAFFKFVLNEGLTRWQLATGTTLLEGTIQYLGRPARYIFLVYLVVWSFFVAAALMSACGVTANAIFPLSSNPVTGKIIYGIILSLSGVVLVRLGGFQLFEKVMSVCIGFMFLTVVVTAILLAPNFGKLISGLFLPAIPQIDGVGVSWTIALIGGVGGTVTMLCYGYWIREEGRFGAHNLRKSRIDLAMSYIMTAVFGLAMVIIGSTIKVDGSGATLVIKLSERLVDKLGNYGRWAFLLGAFGAVFSSLLGVWQSVPYIFTDLWEMRNRDLSPQNHTIDTKSTSYRWYLYGMALVPMIGLFFGFAKMQKFYAICGALFIPMLALVLLLLNSKPERIGKRYRNHKFTSAILMIILLFFLFAAWLVVRNVL